MLKLLCLPSGRAQLCRMCCKRCSGQQQSWPCPFLSVAQFPPCSVRTQSLSPGSPRDVPTAAFPCPGRLGQPLLPWCLQALPALLGMKHPPSAFTFHVLEKEGEQKRDTLGALHWEIGPKGSNSHLSFVRSWSCILQICHWSESCDTPIPLNLQIPEPEQNSLFLSKCLKDFILFAARKIPKIKSERFNNVKDSVPS